ncbi:MAG TPA: hypothetical protein VFJ90_09965, partial [Candidatus Didemnitutus sp.]|nr:hypothetical protein [Candidatus Didemnitutus sp.]
DPPENNLKHLNLVELPLAETPALGVAVDGDGASWPGSAGDPILPVFDSFKQDAHAIYVFNRGKGEFNYTVTASAPWISILKPDSAVRTEHQVTVRLDWTQVPAGTSKGSIKISGAGQEVTVGVEAFHPTEVTRENLKGFVEGNSYVSIEPEHFTKRIDAGANRWMRIADYGRTLSGMRAEAPVDAPSATPGKDSPCLEYQMYLFTTGSVEVTAITSPTMNFVPDRGMRYAVSFDDEEPQVVTLVPQGYQAQNRNPDWEKVVGNNARYTSSTHTVAKPGYHTLKIWMIDPAVVMQKLIVDLGGVKPSYLGPPESFRSK